MRYMLIIALALCGAGCKSPPESDAAKRARIAEMFAGYQKSFPEVPAVSAAELMDAKDREDWVLVDGRTPEEIAVSRIPGAITEEAFEVNRGEYADKTVVVYCTIGYRSGEYAEELREEGIDARNLKGSILSWLHEGGEVVDSSGKPVKRVHVYGKKWDLAPEGYHTEVFE